MSDRVPDRIAVTYSLTASDDVACAAAIDRHSRSWTTFSISLVVLFSAIPVALLFRLLAAERSQNTEMIEMAGRHSLFAFLLGILACWIGASIRTRLARGKSCTGLASHGDSRTVVLESGITLNSRTSHSNLQWSAVTGCSGMRDLLLIWIVPGTAIAIFSRSLDDDGLQGGAGVRPRLHGRSEGTGGTRPFSQPTAKLKRTRPACRSSLPKIGSVYMPLIMKGKSPCAPDRHRFIGLHTVG